MSEQKVESAPGDGWLREENPDVYYMLRALDGDEGAFGWLERKSAALYLFTRALAGDKKALKALESAGELDLQDLDATIATCDLDQWLDEKRPELSMVFEAIKGDDDALRRLRRKRSGLAKLAEALRGSYRKEQQGDPARDPDHPAGGPIPDGAAADMGCLIGEMHLGKGDYGKAVEAFTRSIESNPSPDVYEGRARAYRALALQDERKAQELRGTLKE